MLNAFGNATAPNSTTGWHESPNERGTWTVLTSSIITIALCAWTALHLNVPGPGKHQSEWIRKSKWLLMGVAAPEVVAFIAWRQRREAVMVTKKMRKLLGQYEQHQQQGKFVMFCKSIGNAAVRYWSRISTTRRQKGKARLSTPTPSIPISPSTDPQIHRPPWTLTHGFYATMGGFSLSTTLFEDEVPSPEPATFLPGDLIRATLTPTGLFFLMDHQPSTLPSLTIAQIEDKSKADTFKKTIVCLQAGWFIFSSVIRWAQSLPLSLLEVNAMAHALCAVVIYAFWWRKPVDVLEPTVVGEVGEDDTVQSDIDTVLRELGAYMWMGSRASITTPMYRGWDRSGVLRDEYDAIWYLNPSYSRIADLVFGAEEGARHDGSPPRPTTTQDPAIPQHEHYPLASALYSPTSLHLRIATFIKKRLGKSNPPGLGVRKTAITNLSPKTLKRWSLAHSAIQRFSLHTDLQNMRLAKLRPLPLTSGLPFPLLTTDPSAADRLTLRTHNALSLIGARFTDVVIGLAVAGCLYGGLHLLAWDAPFPTVAEKWLWRVSALAVGVGPVVMAPAICLGEWGWLREGFMGWLGLMRRVGKGSRGNEKRKTQACHEKEANGNVNGNGVEPVGDNGRGVKSGVCWTHTENGGKPKWLWAKMMLFVVFVPLVLSAPLVSITYVFGRVYLVVECFKSMARLPRSVYQDVDWTGYIPHISG